MIQLNIGARVSGYSSSVGLPFSIGPLSEPKKRLLEFGLEAHFKTIELLASGKQAGAVVREYEEWVRSKDMKNTCLRPCHAIGMMEVEQPGWSQHLITFLRKI